MTLISKRISETRKLKGLTQEELGELANVNLRTIQRIENNESEPRDKTLSLICEALGIDIEDLMTEAQNLKKNNFATKLINVLFLIAFNFVLVAVVAYLTLDSNANLNSRIAAGLISFLLPYFVVTLTKHMD